MQKLVSRRWPQGLHPGGLGWSHAIQPVLDQALASSFTPDNYRLVQSTALYDINLDLVAVAPDGTFAGCWIGWFDPATGCAEIEPIGVVPAHRRRGLALALCTETARRVARSGGHHVFINTGPSDMYQRLTRPTGKPALRRSPAV